MTGIKKLPSFHLDKYITLVKICVVMYYCYAPVSIVRGALRFAPVCPFVTLYDIGFV